ncbi:MAG: FHA domain-containing protein [Muribaculaceae bacterium]|nr:FHA domain-containing protein [Muribaculaceae bacterium]
MNHKTAIHDQVGAAGAKGGLYGRTSGSADIRRTYIHGMKRSDSCSSPREASRVNDRETQIILQPRPLAGVLYTVSRDLCGELFPVYAGRNTIGSDPRSDIYLSEATVSASHAVLLVRILAGSDGERVITMSYTDYDSEFGSSVDGAECGYDSVPLRGNEIIRIGRSYRFIFLPLDHIRHGLVIEEGFMSVPREKSGPVKPDFIPSHDTRRDDGAVYPSAVGEEDERAFYGRTYARKEDHSSKKTIGG